MCNLDPRLLPHLPKADRYGPRVEALPGFLLLAVTLFYEQGNDGPACVSSILQVLVRLLWAAGVEPSLRPTVGCPALLCGLDLWQAVEDYRDEWVTDPAAIVEFFVALMDAVDVDPPETPSFTPVGASNKMCWLSCLQSAAAELALSSFLPTPLAHLKGMITGAFRAASLALEHCHSASQDMELSFLMSAGRLHVLPELLSDREEEDGELHGQLLQLLDKAEVMQCNIQLVQRLMSALSKAAQSQGRRDKASSHRVVPSEAVVAARASQAGAIERSLKGLQAFLDSEMQPGTFLKGHGIRTLLQVFDRHHGVRPVLGPVELCMNRCVLLAAECLIAALAGPREQEAADAFTSAGGCRRLLKVVDSLSLRRLTEEEVEGLWWKLRCACLAVLDLVVVNSEKGRAEFVRACGFETVLRATRWDPKRPGSCQASQEVRSHAESIGASGGLQDLLRAVATHALSVVGQVCMLGEEEAGRQLASLTSLAELEHYLDLSPAATAATAGMLEGNGSYRPRDKAADQLLQHFLSWAHELLRQKECTRHPEQRAEANAEGAPAPAAKHCALCGTTPGPGVKLRLCSGCSKVHYCGTACQKAAWPSHKAACRASQQTG